MSDPETSDARSGVELRRVDGALLELLVAAAVGDAAAGEVTPPITPGEEWTPERVEWLRAFHGTRSPDLAGDDAEMTWVLENAADRGITAVRADTTAGNPRALGLLAALGFQCASVDGDAVIAWLALPDPAG